MYKAIHFSFDPFRNEFIEILSALLDMYNFIGIYEDDEKITAYIHEEIPVEDILNEVRSTLFEIGCSITWNIENIQEQNWNKIWESNFDPIIFGDQCVIRAPFHSELDQVRYQIVIEPKMSFGTGHHQTTRLMIEQMLEMDFEDRSVLDMGCGTGVLGILASFKKASKVVAVDIDRWAYENTIENARRNKVEQISVRQGGTELFQDDQFDIILANINRNVLIEQIPDYSKMLTLEGILLLSGILSNDTDTVRRAAEKNKFTLIESSELDDWIAMKYERN